MQTIISILHFKIVLTTNVMLWHHNMNAFVSPAMHST